MFGTMLRVAVVGTAVLGCGGFGGEGTAPGGCETGGAGTLDVALTTPSGITGSVLILGPNSFNQVITGSRTFANLPAGQYELRIRAVVVPPAGSELTGTAFGATGRTVRRVCVIPGSETRAPVGYTLHQASGLLWVAGTGTASISGFEPSVLLSGSGPAEVTLDFGTTTDTAAALGEAFDEMGNLWLADPAGQGAVSGRVLALEPGGLGTSGSPEAAVVIAGNSLNRPSAIAFDNSGNMWLANTGGNNILMYSDDQLALLLAGPSPDPRQVAPAITIASNALGAPIAIAFDQSGNLWVAANDTAGTDPGRVIARFDAASLDASSSNLSPSLVITGDNPGDVMERTSGLVFDLNGGLWTMGGGVRHYIASDLAAGGRRAVQPVLFAASTGNSPQADHGAFDATGRLWLTTGPATLGRIEGSGTVIIPDAFTSNGLIFPANLVFYPSPPGLPVP